MSVLLGTVKLYTKFLIHRSALHGSARRGIISEMFLQSPFPCARLLRFSLYVRRGYVSLQYCANAINSKHHIHHIYTHNRLCGVLFTNIPLLTTETMVLLLLRHMYFYKLYLIPSLLYTQYLYSRDKDTTTGPLI
jgi:hypothetical protein